MRLFFVSEHVIITEWQCAIDSATSAGKLDIAVHLDGLFGGNENFAKNIEVEWCGRLATAALVRVREAAYRSMGIVTMLGGLFEGSTDPIVPLVALPCGTRLDFQHEIRIGKMPDDERAWCAV